MISCWVKNYKTIVAVVPKMKVFNINWLRLKKNLVILGVIKKEMIRTMIEKEVRGDKKGRNLFQSPKLKRKAAQLQADVFQLKTFVIHVWIIVKINWLTDLGDCRRVQKAWLETGNDTNS